MSEIPELVEVPNYHVHIFDETDRPVYVGRSGVFMTRNVEGHIMCVSPRPQPGQRRRRATYYDAEGNVVSVADVIEAAAAYAPHVRRLNPRPE